VLIFNARSTRVERDQTKHLAWFMLGFDGEKLKSD
jgi:hypothetical protein